MPSGLGREGLREEALASSGPDSEGHIKVREEHLAYILGVELFEPNLAERMDVGGAPKALFGKGSRLVLAGAAV